VRFLRTCSVVLILGAALAGCGSSSAGTSVRPSVSASPGLTATWRPTAAPVGPKVECLPQSWTGMMLFDATDGSEIVWSNGRNGEQWAPDLYSWIPGESGPTSVFIDKNRSAQINSVAVHHGKYAFEELFTNPDGTTGWRLWYVSARGAEPVVLDSNAGDPQGLAVPAILTALTDGQLTWQAVHLVHGQEMWSLRSHDFLTGITRTLVEAPERQTEYWFPNADDRGRLVYSTMEYGPDHSAETAAYHVYVANLSDDPIKPRRLDKDGLAAEPVLAGDGDTVVWKSVSPGSSVGTWGQLARYSLARDAVDSISVDGQHSLNYESAGNRFVVGWEWNSTSFVAYDLETDSTLPIEHHEPTSSINLVWAVVAGDMTVFIRTDTTLPGGQNKWLCYARLPPLGSAG
jgi:hypothetical protein